MSFKSIACATLVALVASLSPAVAQTLRTFVSGQGADSGACGNSTPCRSFAYAITQTSPGGEIVVLNSAGYGSVTIKQSISIVNPAGVEAGIATSGGSAINVVAGPNDVVALRGLTLEGGGQGLYGIYFQSGAKLEVTDCVIRDFTNSGIIGQANSGGLSTILVANTRVLNNQNAGIYLTPINGTFVQFSLDQITADDNNYGIYIDGSTQSTGALRGSITNSSMNNDKTTGVSVLGPQNNSVYVAIRDSNILLPQTGVYVSGSGTFVFLYRTNVFLAAQYSVNLVNNGNVYSPGNNDLSTSPTPVNGGSPISIQQE